MGMYDMIWWCWCHPAILPLRLLFFEIKTCCCYWHYYRPLSAINLFDSPLVIFHQWCGFTNLVHSSAVEFVRNRRGSRKTETSKNFITWRRDLSLVNGGREVEDSILDFDYESVCLSAGIGCIRVEEDFTSIILQEDHDDLRYYSSHNKNATPPL